MKNMVKVLAVAVAFGFAGAVQANVEHVVVSGVEEITNGYPVVQSEPMAVFGGAILVTDTGTLGGDFRYVQAFEFAGIKADFAGGAIASSGYVGLTNMVFTGNRCEEEDYSAGGALFADTNAVTQLERVDFTGNDADEGGAFFNCGVATLVRVGFYGNGNEAMENGAAIYNGPYASLYLNEVTFDGNFPNEGTGYNEGGTVYNFGEITLGGNVYLETAMDTFYNRGTLRWDLTNAGHLGYLSNFALLKNEVNLDYGTATGRLEIVVNAGDVPGVSRYVLAGGAAKKQPEPHKYFYLTGVAGVEDTLIRIDRKDAEPTAYNGKDYLLYIEDGELILEVTGTSENPIVVKGGQTNSLTGTFCGYTNDQAGAIFIESGATLLLGDSTFIANRNTGYSGALEQQGAFFVNGNVELCGTVNLSGANQGIYSDGNLMWDLTGVRTGCVLADQPTYIWSEGGLVLKVNDRMELGEYLIGRNLNFTDKGTVGFWLKVSEDNVTGLTVGGDMVTLGHTSYRLEQRGTDLVLCTWYAQREPDYADANDWFIREDTGTKDVDLIFISPTTAVTNNYATVDGCADINDPQLRNGGFAAEWKRTGKVFADYTRVLVPYYRQLTQEAIFARVLNEDGSAKEDSVEIWTTMVKNSRGYQDICKMLDWYFANNGTRKFILAGHSQGSLVLKCLLDDYFTQHADKLANMVACYMPGIGISETKLAGDQVSVATNATDAGVFVTWNTEGAGNLSNLVLKAGAQAINPLNWKTDATPAPESENLGALTDPDAGTVVPGLYEAAVDTARGAVICTNLTDYMTDKAFGEKSLHDWDYRAYWQNLKVNGFTRYATKAELVPVNTNEFKAVENATWELVNDDGTVASTIIGYVYPRTGTDLKVVYKAESGYYFVDGSTSKEFPLTYSQETGKFESGVLDLPVAGKPAVQLGVVMQRYPWNGLVDVFYRVAYISGTGFSATFYTELGGTRTNLIENVSLDGKNSEKTYHECFDARALLGEGQFNDLEISVEVNKAE